MSLPGYVHIPSVAGVPHGVSQLKQGDLIESRFGEVEVTLISNDGPKRIISITTTHGVILTSPEQEWFVGNTVWMKASEITTGLTLMYYHGSRTLTKTELVVIQSVANLAKDTVYRLVAGDEYVAAGHVTR